MKKIKLFGVILLSLYWATSCNVLDKVPLDEISDDAFWKDSTLVEYYVNDLYWEVPVDAYLTNESRSDNSVGAQRDKWRSSSFMFNYNLITASDPGDNIWNSYYTKIRKCNRFFERISNAPLTESTKNLMSGQVYFLRGLFYFDLVKSYGGVVLLDKVLTMSDNWNLPRSSEEECYEFILSDLTKAAELLPTSWSGSAKGRITKGAALALRSRVNLYGKRYEDCVNDCAAIYDLGEYELVPGKTPEEYRSIWWITNKDNKEIIFDLQYKSPDLTNYLMVYNMVCYLNEKYGDRGWGGLGPTQELIDEFELADGTPARQYANVSGDQIFDIEECGIYKNREPRFYANIVFHGSQIFFNADKGPVTVDRYLYDTPDKIDASLTGYNVWKWIDYDNYGYPYEGASSPDFAINWIKIRYAEIFLNDAEARVEMGDVAGALKAVNVIRERVGLPALTETNRDKLRELIRKERRLELAFEDQRFWDVRRWRIGNETQKTLHGVKFVSPTEFQVVVTDTRVWDDRLYLHPIPYSEILRQNALVQNKGF